MAPTMTNASEGAQAPARSRKPTTFEGSLMPETIRPRPNNRPAANALSTCIAGSREKVADDEYRREAGRHEGDGGRSRARRQPRQAASPVAARAARAIARAEPHQESR